MIRVTYHYSACVRIDTAEASVLCDPWFTEGIYDGSWYHYPPVDDPMGRIGACDFVYVSHIHPDHYDPAFLRAYQRAHPRARILIADFEHNHLARVMRADGIEHEVVHQLEIGDTVLTIEPNEAAVYEVDSALIVQRGGHSVVNMNDNPYHGEQIERIRSTLGGSPTIALLGYTGAGPYPQTYHDDEARLLAEAEAKKQRFFTEYLKMRDALDPKLTIPFAGKYILGGRLHGLNPYRGVADACEVLAIDPRAVVLADGGQASVDTESLTPSAVRTQPYDPVAVAAHAASFADRPMDYERYFGDVPVSALPLLRLLPKAFANAHARSVTAGDYYYCFPVGERWFVANARREGGAWELRDEVASLEPRSEIEIDPRYLFGLITCVFHWNNAEIGSQYRTRRVPDSFNRDARAFLNFFHV